MSTDTAFALGMLALIGRRLPDRLRAFMLTVAVVDDLVALVVIATVYTDHLQLRALLVASSFDARASAGANAHAPSKSATAALKSARS